MRNLIGVSGKIHSGKDTVGKIIQILTNFPTMREDRIIEHLNKEMTNNVYEIKKFADKLKDCVCLIIGCTREQLEDQEFKNTPLGPEWDTFWYTNGIGDRYLTISEETARIEHTRDYGKRQMTPRLMLQLMGTEAGRRIIHPNIWVNASFAEYVGDNVFTVTESDGMSGTQEIIYPNWIFTDMRFPNELEAIKSRDGITIRVNRPDKQLPNAFLLKNRRGGTTIATIHESETALDNSNFDYYVNNDGSLSDLVIKVNRILEIEKII